VAVRSVNKSKKVRKAIGMPPKLQIVKGIEGGQCYKDICTAMIIKLLYFIASAVRREM
jgi:hypothetical protein